MWGHEHADALWVEVHTRAVNLENRLGCMVKLRRYTSYKPGIGALELTAKEIITVHKSLWKRFTADCLWWGKMAAGWCQA